MLRSMRWLNSGPQSQESGARPRGVLQTHRNLFQVARRYVNSQAISLNDRITFLPSCTVTASLGNMFGTLLSGAALFPFKVRELVFSALIDWIVAEEITFLSLVAHYFPGNI
jgi:non-ribosomal peptide synthetase component F